jgi:hypothetical protein
MFEHSAVLTSHATAPPLRLPTLLFMSSRNHTNLPSRFPLPVSTTHARPASSALLPIQLPPSFPGSVQDALAASELPAPAPHDTECDWTMGARAPRRGEPATFVSGHARARARVEGRERAGGLHASERRLALAEGDALDLGALDIALDARSTDGQIRVPVLPTAAAPNAILAVPTQDTMDEEGDPPNKTPRTLAFVPPTGLDSLRRARTPRSRRPRNQRCAYRGRPARKDRDREPPRRV